MRRFRLKVVLDPQPEDRAALAAWPQQPLVPDFIVVASGWVAIEIGSRPVLYRNGSWVAEPASAPSGDPFSLPESHIGDYVALFLLRLLDTSTRLADRHVHLVQFGDNPACLSLRRAGACIRVGYREQPSARDLLATHILSGTYRRVAGMAARAYIAQLLALNPALENQADVRALQEGTERLLAPTP